MSRSRSLAEVVPLSAPLATPLATPVVTPVVVVGHVVGVSAPALLVEVRGHGVVRARVAIRLTEAEAAEAAASRAEATLVFLDDDRTQALVMGIVQTELPRVAGATEARVDGRRVVLEGSEEVVLRCGEATITLRANGKVEIRGAYVETRASGTNRIKGGSVQIN